MKVSFLKKAAAVVVLTFSAALVNVPSASAVTCYGDYCSGVDPLSSGCSGDAKTIASAYVYGSGGTAQVNLRWSPTCKTNWAQANFVTSSIKAVQYGGYPQEYSNNNGTNSWSKMIYSPSLCVKASIWGGWGVTDTACL
ncbi:hypothetical protein CPI83_29080 (plasmid) [Rhodococcus sp. H-CA8f]|uniref:DUF2690 domain-containing protein n=1 Tax=Rhodococcus sp. H-CA8f TaxID=1727214 RepID=UPI000BE24211|nr:DUF2690 domain-containing protein [Rhodococcus sp. H-CA8f]ATI36263.1 hypothetical protein CPI83_29080 [Rhodococcus sp. H-CA8f]